MGELSGNFPFVRKGSAVTPKESQPRVAVIGSSKMASLGGVRLTNSVLLGYGHTVIVPVSCFGHLGVVFIAPSCPSLRSPFPGPSLPAPSWPAPSWPGEPLPGLPGWLLLDRGGSVLHVGEPVSVKLLHSCDEWVAVERLRDTVFDE